MGIGVMTGRCSAPPARHRNMDPLLSAPVCPGASPSPTCGTPLLSHMCTPQNIEADFWEMALERVNGGT